METEILKLKQRIIELEDENDLLKEKQMEINQAKQLYLKIFDEFPALIWRSGLDKLCDFFNKTWLEFTGRTMEQEYGNGWTEGVHPEDLEFCINKYITAFDKREPFVMNYRLKNKFGEYRWIRDYGRPFYDLDDTFLGYIGSCYDITDNKNNELALIELNATKDKFFSIIAHDLRSPLLSLVGLTDLLSQRIQKYDKAKIEQHIAVINKSTHQTYNLLEDLLLWSMLQSDKLTFNPQKVELAEICHEIIEEQKENAAAKAITVKCDDLNKTTLTADLNMLKTILRNLISNAIKFTNPSGVVSLAAETNPEETIITVSDNGIGMSSEKIATLWDLSDNTSKKGTADENGMGLGLTLCKEFVEKHGGKIWVKSTLEKGSDFKFTIPA